MRIRLWSVFVLAGVVVGATLLPWGRVPAGDAPPPTASRTESAHKDLAPAPGGVKVPTMMVNSRRIRLNFNIAEVGPSGVSSVELWATRDGRTWQRYSSEPPPSGPLVVHVAEEGRYGFSLVVKSGVGLGAPPPCPGDAPQLWVEVDETRPKVRLLHAEVGKGPESDCLLLSWMASDVNLMPHPITLSTATSRDGPWTPVAAHLENTGKYVWRMPKDVPYQFYVRVEASDRAGNRGVDCCPEPVKVDRARPRGTILGIDAEKKAEASTAPTLDHAPVGAGPAFSFWTGQTR
jgi:hypothetical protein